jgi:uncharacterized protein with von Willebrand factor type A (vWA) domain
LKHYTDYSSFTEAFVGFAQLARYEGFAIGIQCTKDSISAALQQLWLDRDIFEHALMALFCKEEDERDAFSNLFKKFWRHRGTIIKDTTVHKNKRSSNASSKSSAVMLGKGDKDNENSGEESKTTSGANTDETLKRTDFSLLSEKQSEELDEISEKLVREMSLRIRRKRKKAKKGQINIAESIRKNIQNGGTIIDLQRKDRKRDKFQLLILLDVSGSMDKYSFYLLKFLWALRSHFKQVEVFTFSTKLVRITDFISEKNMALALTQVSYNAKHWSSGTKIGQSLQTFNDQYAKKYMNGKTLTLILSDGLDTGELVLLENAIKQIKLRSKKLIWLNPLKGSKGYQPIQRGMKTALPSLNHFGSAHNFNSLLELENILSYA